MAASKPKAPSKAPAKAPEKKPAKAAHARPTPPVASAAAPVDYVLPNFPDPTALAEQLGRFLREQQLVTMHPEDPEARPYIGLEGWQFIGAELGQAAIVEWCQDQSTNDWQTFHARASLVHVSTGTTLGAGEGVADSFEQGLQDASGQVLAALAQSRAVIAAFYHSLGWLVRLAGFDATPEGLVPYLPGVWRDPETKLETEPETQAQPASEPAPTLPPPVAPEPAATPAPRPTLRQGQQQLNAQAQAVLDAKPKGLPMRADQRQELEELIEHEKVHRDEKLRVLTKINGYDEAGAASAIKELKKRIDERLKN